MTECVLFVSYPDLTTETRVDEYTVAKTIFIPVVCILCMVLAVVVVIRQCMLASRIKLFLRDHRTTYDLDNGLYGNVHDGIFSNISINTTA